jgi:cation transport ATPase
MTKVINKVSVNFPWSFILFLVFLVLKLTEVIDWSWWWITAPLWLPIIIIVGMEVVFFLVVTIASLIEKWK